MIKDFRKANRPRQTVILFVYSSLIVVCAACAFGADVKSRILAYTIHSDTLDGPATYVLRLNWIDPVLYMLCVGFPLILDMLIMAMEVRFLNVQEFIAHSFF
jgi:hypothetical protein